MSGPGSKPGQMLLVEEFFASENDAFLEAIQEVSQAKSLAAFTDRWKKDPRPWARRQMLAYLQQPLNRAGHQPVVKRLFKHAEQVHDHEVMALFLVAFDRQVRRCVRVKRRWDFQSRTVVDQEKLVTPRDYVPDRPRTTRNPMTGEVMTYQPASSGYRGIFSYRTRYYLRRRVWRYFRVLGHREPALYIRMINSALQRYTDDDLRRGENILDNWGLMHACFAEHEAVDFHSHHVRLKEGRSLSELSPAPQFPAAWKSAESAPLLLELTLRSSSRLIRTWSTQLFTTLHSGHPVAFDTILSLLDHSDSEIQEFGAKLFENSSLLGALPLSTWLKALDISNDAALQRICDAFARHVAADRLSFDQCLQLACARYTPVARLGLNCLRNRNIPTADRARLIALSEAKSRAVSGDLTAWALSLLGTRDHYLTDQVVRFFDASLQETRAAAWGWLVADSPGLTDPILWSRLSETPYDDLRLRVIDHLERQTIPDAKPNDLQRLWQSVLLSVHRGGRQKQKAVQQIAAAVSSDTHLADQLIPVLAAAVRSVRAPEARAGLSAITTIIQARPELAPLVRRILPEMKFLEDVAV